MLQVIGTGTQVRVGVRWIDTLLGRSDREKL